MRGGERGEKGGEEVREGIRCGKVEKGKEGEGVRLGVTVEEKRKELPNGIRPPPPPPPPRSIKAGTPVRYFRELWA